MRPLRLLSLVAGVLLLSPPARADERDEALQVAQENLITARQALQDEQQFHAADVARLQAELAQMNSRLEQTRVEQVTAQQQLEVLKVEQARQEARAQRLESALRLGLERSEFWVGALEQRIDVALAGLPEHVGAALRPPPANVKVPFLPAPRADEAWVLIRARVALARQVDLEFDEVTLADATQWFEAASGLRVSVAPEAASRLEEARVTLHAKGLALAEVLRLLYEPYEMNVRWSDDHFLVVPM